MKLVVYGYDYYMVCLFSLVSKIVKEREKEDTIRNQ